MELTEISQILEQSGLTVKSKYDRIIDFHFLSVMKQLEQKQGEMLPYTGVAFMVYIQADQYIVETGVAGILTMHQNPTVIAKTILDYCEVNNREVEYRLYRGISTIKQSGYMALFEDNTIYIYQIKTMPDGLDQDSIDEQIRATPNFNRQNPYAAIRYEGDFWVYESPVRNIQQKNLTLEQSIALFKNQSSKSKLDSA